ncbi:ATP-binding protein [Planctomycetota bacterium]|jgi:signal transduction histidine kinase|nr:ATP-binding protein [Planctomycetota bacterium]
MIRRISTKWVLAVLAVVVLPFLGFAWYVHDFVSERFADDVVRYHLLGHAAELSDRLDRIVDERREDAVLLASAPTVSAALRSAGEQEGDAPAGGLAPTVHLLDQLVQRDGAAEFVVVLGSQGQVVATNSKDRSGRLLEPEVRGRLVGYPWREQAWFGAVLAGESVTLDQGQFDLKAEEQEGDRPELRRHFGFAEPIQGEESLGAVLTLVPWSVVQGEIENYGVRRADGISSGAASADLYDSSYSWVWASDADTILAHPNRSLYGERVSGPRVNLAMMGEAVRRSSGAGMYPDYEFLGVRKKAAFKQGRTKDQSPQGLGWVVGVGVDYPDIYGPVEEITRTIAKASMIVLLLAVIVTVVVARRTTRPVQDLEAFTRRVASGDLDAQVTVHGHDELADLARSFNRMTRELKENRAQLVEAEKDAAWREMARQVAHEIKNPLTPIQLSASLLKRAHDEGSPEFPAILERTIEVVQRQVGNMRDIARDFYTFAGQHRDPVPVDAGVTVAEVFDLNEAWASEVGVRLEKGESLGEGRMVRADPDELQRALVNLVSNAIEASSDGGVIRGEVSVDGSMVRVTIEDSGRGIGEEAGARLFEPYFTTRSSGTGLGLAIVRRIVEDLGGAVSVTNREDGPGARAVIQLPQHENRPGERPA